MSGFFLENIDCTSEFLTSKIRSRPFELSSEISEEYDETTRGDYDTKIRDKMTPNTRGISFYPPSKNSGSMPKHDFKVPLIEQTY